MNLRSRARKLFGHEKLSEHAVKASRIDHAVLRDVRRRAAAIEGEIAEPPTLPNGEKLHSRVWERLAEDLFSEFYGDDEPQLRQRDQIDPQYHVNHQLADKQQRGEGFAETRSMTRGEVTESALGLRGALRSFRASYGEELAEHGERQNEIAKTEDQLADIDDMLEKLRQDRRDTGDHEQIDPQVRELAKAKRAAVDRGRQLQREQLQQAGSIIDAAKQAASRAAGAAEKAVEAASLLPGSQAGPGSHQSSEQMIAFAERVGSSPVLRAVLDMMGRIELSMGTQRRQFRRGGYEELVDITTGSDLRAVLPAEKMLLVHPVARLDFYRRFHERSLMEYEYQSEEELKKGPIIFATDGSASMKGPRNIFARGLTLAGCAIGNRERRNTAAIEFGSTGQMREFRFPGDRPFDTAVALDFAEHFYRGGTDINQTLARAKELIDSEAPFHSADLVIVTDGGDLLDAQTISLRDALRAMGVRIHGLIIGARPTPYLIEVCDVVTPVLDFAGPNTASDRLAIDLT